MIGWPAGRVSIDSSPRRLAAPAKSAAINALKLTNASRARHDLVNSRLALMKEQFMRAVLRDTYNRLDRLLFQGADAPYGFGTARFAPLALVTRTVLSA